MPNWTSSTADATAAERQTAFIPARIPGSPDVFKEVPATDFMQKDTNGDLNNTGIIRGGSGDAPSGGVWAAMRYAANQMPHVFGGMYSSAKILIGFGVRSSTTALDTFVSSIDNASWARGALVVGDDLKFYSSGAQTTAVGSVVSMAERFSVASNGTVNIPVNQNYRINGKPVVTANASTTYYYSSGTGGILFRNAADTANLLALDDSGNLRPGADNAQDLGAASNRMRTIYAGTSAINTSDKREKQNIGDIPDAWLDAWGDVKWQRFKFIDAVKAKGDDARWHIGLIAQDVHAAFADHDLDAFEIGLCCYDEWDEVSEPVLDDDGNETGETRVILEAGDRWGLRYDECQAMEAAWQRREIARLNARLAVLESA